MAVISNLFDQTLHSAIWPFLARLGLAIPRDYRMRRAAVFACATILMHPIP